MILLWETEDRCFTTEGNPELLSHWRPTGQSFFAHQSHMDDSPWALFILSHRFGEIWGPRAESKSLHRKIPTLDPALILQGADDDWPHTLNTFQLPQISASLWWLPCWRKLLLNQKAPSEERPGKSKDPTRFFWMVGACQLMVGHFAQAISIWHQRICKQESTLAWAW